MKTLMLCLLATVHTACPLINLKYVGELEYQPIYINGKTLRNGQRDCQQRYEAIKATIEKIIAQKGNEYLTVLDLGASQGYFSFRLAHEFPHITCIMIEGDFSFCRHATQQLLELCQLNTDVHAVIVFLKKSITAQDLIDMNSREHFDLVLSLSILHHFHDDWQCAVDATLQLADTIIIETPPTHDPLTRTNKTVIPLEQYIQSYGPKIIGQAPRTPVTIRANIYLFENQLHTNKQSISAETFAQLNGVWPQV